MRRPVSHVRRRSLAKELLAAFVGAELDRWFETQGLDHLGRDEVVRLATEGAHRLLGR